MCQDEGMTTKEQVRLEVARVIANATNWPEPLQARMLGHDLSEPIDMIVDALIPILWSVWDDGYDDGHFVAETRGLEVRRNPYR